MESLAQQIRFRSLLTIGPYENDPGFVNVLTVIAQRGMFIYGLLGTILVITYVVLNIWMSGRSPVWTYTNLNTATDITLTDKSLIFLFCQMSMYLSAKKLSLKVSRAIIFIIAWMICTVMLLDDILARSIAFSTVSYITIALIIAVATIPYRGWHTASFLILVMVTMPFVVHWMPQILGQPPMQFDLSQQIYMFLIAFVLTGMSSQIYLNRYEQYRARRRAEELGEQLEERASELELMKQKLELQADKLLENEKLKDQFFANISHEFRTPLTLILGPLTDILDRNQFEEKQKIDRRTLQRMHKNADQLLQLINQLLDLSRIDAKEIALKLKPVNVSEFVATVVRSFAPMAESKKINLSCFTKGQPLIAEIDQREMDRAIGNLITNALKFTAEEGDVTVTVSQEKSGTNDCVINIKDNGIGISKEELTHIFDRFYRGSNISKFIDQGTGIGLALAQEIVKLHGGEIIADSKPGKGTEFTIRLQCAAEGLEEEAVNQGREQLLPQESAGLDYDLGSEGDDLINEKAPIVLLIDDNPDILSYLKSYISQRYSVISQQNSSEALTLIRSQPVDLIISDVMMPYPDGFELCRIVKEDPKLNHIPFILLTARTAEENRVEGLNLGADDYISKPFSASELMVRVENLIELRQMLKNKYSRNINITGKKIEVESEDARFLEQVQSVIENHIAESNFTVDWLADEVNLSSRQLQRKIRAITNLSAGGYIRMMRLERAHQLLVQRWGNISQISYAVGFRDPKYFSRLFKQTFGEPPSGLAD